MELFKSINRCRIMSPDMSYEIAHIGWFSSDQADKSTIKRVVRWRSGCLPARVVEGVCQKYRQSPGIDRVSLGFGVLLSCRILHRKVVNSWVLSC
jgi:hypothetical protein